jgi:hypothetical protein
MNKNKTYTYTNTIIMENTLENNTIGDKTLENEIPEDKTLENEIPEDKTLENEIPENETHENKIPEDKTLENEIPENETHENETHENKIPEDKTLEDKTLENEISFCDVRSIEVAPFAFITLLSYCAVMICCLVGVIACCSPIVGVILFCCMPVAVIIIFLLMIFLRYMCLLFIRDILPQIILFCSYVSNQINYCTEGCVQYLNKECGCSDFFISTYKNTCNLFSCVGNYVVSYF